MLCNDRFPLDIIKVTENVPLFSASEAAEVVANAEAEGVDKNEFKSGKYQLAGKAKMFDGDQHALKRTALR